ncbi:30S ribosomal protein S15 [bacterium]|nr:30S ribosomal protein S15 [bacterium]
MAQVKERKHEIIDDFKRHGKDCGSSEVQIALLTDRINTLTEHFKVHKHDNTSKRGLLRLIGKRKRLLKYLKDTDNEKYLETISRLGIRK